MKREGPKKLSRTLPTNVELNLVPGLLWGPLPPVNVFQFEPTTHQGTKIVLNVIPF